MGANGRINGSIGNLAHSTDYGYYIEYSEGNYNINANTSPVTAIVYIECYNHTAYDYSRTFTTTLNIGGEVFSRDITGMSLSPGTKIELCRGTYDVPHNADGSKTINISSNTPTLPSGGGYGPQSGSASGNVTLTTIPRASKVSLNSTNFTIGNVIRINTNRASSSFTHKAKITFNGKTLADKNNIGAYLDWNTSDLFSLMTDKVEATGTVTLYTYSGSTQIGNPTSVNFTANARNQKPTFTNFQYEDTNNTILNLTGNNQKLVLKYSKVKVKVPTSMKMIPKNSATGKEYQVSAQNMSTVSIKYSSTSEVNTTISNFNSTQITVTAYDSRNNSTGVTKQLSSNIIPYEELKLTSSFKLERTNFVGNSITISGGGTWKNVNFGKKSNSIKIMTIQIQNPGGAWSQLYDIKNLFTFDSKGTWYNKSSNEFSSFNFLFGIEYNVKITISDELSTITVNSKVNGGNVLLDALKGYGVSIGGIFNKLKGVFQVHKDADELLDLNSNGDLNIKGKFKTDFGIDSSLLSKGIISPESDGQSSIYPGLSIREVYNNGYPTTYGNCINVKAGGGSQLLLGWEGTSKRGKIYYRSLRDVTSDGTTWSGWGRIYTHNILYDNTSGTTGTVTLSENAADYDYLEIYYCDSNYKIYKCTKVHSPNGKKALLDTAYTFGFTSNVRIAASRQVQISGTTITTIGEYGVWSSFSGITNENRVSIFKVVGYR